MNLFSTFDGLLAFTILIAIPLLIAGWAIWLERDGSAAIEVAPMATVLGQGLRTVLLAVMLTILPSLMGAFSSILQLVYRPDGGGWVVQPGMTFVVPPTLYLVAVILIVRRALALQRWLKKADGR